MPNTHTQQPPTDSDATTQALEPLVVAMQRTIDEAFSRRNVALATAAVMRVVAG